VSCPPLLGRLVTGGLLISDKFRGAGISLLDVLLLEESQGKVQPCMPKKVRRADG